MCFLPAALAQQNPDSAATHILMEEALAALLRAEKLDPKQPEAHYRLARLYREMKHSAASEKEFAKVRELHEKTEGDVGSKMAAPTLLLPQ